MKDLILSLSFIFLLQGLKAQKKVSECQDSCTDYHRICPAIADNSYYALYESWHNQDLLGPLQRLDLPPKPNCGDYFYKAVCPRSCGMCTPCEVKPKDLAAIKDKTKELEKELKDQKKVINNIQSVTNEVSNKVDRSSKTIKKQGDSIKVINKDIKETNQDINKQKKEVDKLTKEVAKCCDGKKEDGGDSTKPDVDKEGYRLVFRHTSNQLTIKDFVNFFLKGVLPGAFFNNQQSSQYKEEHFFKFWHDTKTVRLDAFDMQGKLKKSTFFDIPKRDGKEFTTWAKVFGENCEYISNKKNKQYNKISKECKHSLFYAQDDSDQNKHSAMMMATSDDCEKQQVYFMLNPGKGMGTCDWQNKMREATMFDNDYTVAFYNSFQKALNNFVGLNVASKFEIRFSGSFAKNSINNGFQKVFRYPSYAGVHVMDYYQDGEKKSDKDRYDPNAKMVDTSDMYRSKDLPDKIKDAAEILFVIYDESGFVEETLTFKGSGDLTSWFSTDNLLSSMTWDFTGVKFDYFDLNIPRRTKHGRYFIINTYSWTCNTDKGYFLLSCKKDKGFTNCDYERMVEGAEDAEDYICMIQYTKSGKPITYTEFDKRRIGSAIEIFTRPKKDEK